MAIDLGNDPKFSFIVPVHDVPADVFKRCLMSIADQDYPNIEVVIVPNGGDKEAEAMAREFSDGREGWTVLPIEEKGACNARNAGFKVSTGEIVSFFNSDYIAKIGMVRMWVDALVAHPECGFAYGAYEYACATRDVYWSKEFDVFQLGVANYIDCGFPLWRKNVVEWDPEVKSLQDWDFWLRVVRGEGGEKWLQESRKASGYALPVKGHFLGREISFIAELPRAKGLSHDSSGNWLDRVKFVKEKNGISLRDICVASIGAPNHGVEIAKMIGADFRDDTLHKPHEYKALYLIGWYMKPNQQTNGHTQILQMFDRPGIKKIVHFVGADIYWLRKFSYENLKALSGALTLSCEHILSENEAAQAELRAFGIESQIVPIPPYSDYLVAPYPNEFSVAVYLTDKSDFDKYLQSHTLSIVKAMPDVKFHGYGDGAKGFTAPNFTHAGTMPRNEWEKFVYANSASLRLVRHDTRPMASDEFIMAGRSVITNVPAPYMDVIDTSGDLKLNEWDHFGAGFSAWRWPNTKKRIVQKIREVRERQKKLDGEFMGQRIVAASEYRQTLNKDAYRSTIKSLALTPKLEVVHA